jgi:hypothetical protein
VTLRALLIGSETFGLSGCNADVALMRDVLTLRHFTDIKVLVDAEATREQILAGYEWLIAASAARDPAVVYYSGHGGRLPLPDWEARQAAGRDAFAQFIVPHDMAETTATDFRGLLSAELSGLQSRLTAQTDNVTTILDCSHSGLMSRDALLIPKAIARDFPPDAAFAKLAEIEAQGNVSVDDSNPDAVRVVACAPGQSAFEGPSQFRPGERHGLLTDALATFLLLTDGPLVSWRTLAERLRVTVGDAAPTQRPEVEGPSSRLPFSVQEEARKWALPVRGQAGQLWIDGAELLGVSAGDRYLLLGDGGDELGAATAGAPSAGRAQLHADGRADDVSRAVRAVPLRTSSRLPVRIELSDPLRATMLTAISSSGSLLVSRAGQPAIGSVTFDDGLLVTDSTGLPLHSGRLGADPAGVRKATGLLENAARAHRFRLLQPADVGSRLAQRADVQFSLHSDDGSRRMLAGSGERLFVGDRVSMTIRNLGPAPLFFWLFDVGPDSTIALVTDASPSGRVIARAGQPGDAQTVGGPSGTALQWSGTLPRDGGRPETLMVIVADHAQDLSLLQTRAAARGEDTAGGGAHAAPPLEAALGEAGTGVRTWPAESASAASLRYRVDIYDVILEPGRRTSSSTSRSGLIATMTKGPRWRTCR